LYFFSIDSFLPRVCELATTSSVRQTKVREDPRLKSLCVILENGPGIKLNCVFLFLLPKSACDTTGYKLYKVWVGGACLSIESQ